MSNITPTPTIINPYGRQDFPIDGGQQSEIGMLAGILFELRVQTQYLRAIASGTVANDDPNALRQDEYVDPQFIRLS
jgi:hypothetical protein